MSEKVEFTEKINCPICFNQIPMKIKVIERIISEYIHNVPEMYDGATNDCYWQIVQCPACSKHFLREGWWNEIVGDEWGPEFSIIYPSFEKKNFNLPPTIQKSYDAAQKVKNIETNAFAVLLGRVLDKICIDKNSQGDTLFARLKDLADKGFIPEIISDMAHSIRQLRNIGAHAELGDLTDEEVPILEEIINVILEYLYAAPAMVQKVKAKVDALKQNSSGTSANSE